MNKKNMSRHKWLILYLVLLSAVIGGGFFATEYLGDMARREIVKENEATIALFSTHLTDEFKRIEGAVKALSGSPWIAPALISGKDQDIVNANAALDRYNSSMRTSASYLMDRTGKTIASSNRDDPDSFVGKSYRFRPYFVQAASGNRGRYFALGITSLKRGFYASFPVRDARGAIVGVIAIKTDLDDMEATLSGHSHFFFIDHHGVIFLSGIKEMLFKSLWPVGREAERALLASKQFGEKPFEAVFSQEIADGMDVTLKGKRYIVSRRVVDPEGWSVVFMNPTERIFLYRSTGVILTLLICTFIIIPLIVQYRTVRSAELLRSSEARFRELFNTMNSGVIIYRANDKGEEFIITDINPAGERISRVKRQEIVGKTVEEIFPGVREIGLFDVLQDSWKTGAHKFHPESLYRDNRISHWVENNVYRLTSGEIVAIYDDVTERKRMGDEIRALSIMDQLTGLSNRRGFLALAEQQLKIADRTKKELLLLYLDLDGMKWINDTLGHKEGDNALIEVAAVLKETFRSSDIVARIGGDEFAVLAIDMTEGNADIQMARLQDQIDRYNGRENRRYRLSVSVGCSCYDPENPCSIDELMASADERMYIEKRRKREVREA
jgi:diguanylate cyclase (GGDEF)-like protein/PAS domain S-box-containing protein